MKTIIGNIGFREAAFLASLITTFLASFLPRQKNNIPMILSTLGILFISFGYRYLIFIILDVALNMAFVYLRLVNSWFLTVINIAIIYLEQIFTYKIEPNHKMQSMILVPTYVLMTNTMKVCYLGTQFNIKNDSVFDMLGYFFHAPGILLSPPPTFELYMKKKETSERGKFPTLIFIWSMVSLGLYVWVKTKIDIDDIIYSGEFKKTYENFAMIYALCVCEKFKFYFAWNFSYGCYILQGFDEMKNIDFFRVEFARDVKDLTIGWNTHTNIWLKKFFFEKLKDKSVYLAGFITYTVSALWHSYTLDWLILFLSFFVITPIVRNVNIIYKKILFPIYPIITRAQMMFLVCYISIPFMSRESKDIFIVWKSVYFIGHIYLLFCIFLIFLSHMIAKLFKTKQQSNEKI